jgi:NAD-dependent oxidoreductase involved in siderophore biosynthesis
VCKTLLNIAHCLGYMLDVRSWYIILEAMQRIEAVAKRSNFRRNNPSISQANGSQTLVDFADIRIHVLEKMTEYDLGQPSQ